MRKVRNKNKKTLIIVALLVVITLGYAYLSQLLTINGTGIVDNMSWDIHFENPTVTANSNITPTTAPEADPQDKVKDISYEVEFTKPGDVYEFKVDVVNGGTIDGMVEEITSTIKINDAEPIVITKNPSNLPAYLEYDVTYEDGTEIEANHLLAANDKEVYLVHVGIKKDISKEDLPGEEKTLILTMSPNMIQRNSNVINRHPTTLYTLSNYDFETVTKIGQNISNDIRIYNTQTEIMNAWKNYTNDQKIRPFYLKHKLNGNSEIEESYVEFVVTEEIAETNPGMVVGTYALRGGVDESNLQDKKVFNANIDILKSALSNMIINNNCIETTDEFSCEIPNNVYEEEIQFEISSNGFLLVGDDEPPLCAIVVENEQATSFCA